MKANRLYSYFLSVAMIFLVSSCQPTDKKTPAPSQKIKKKPSKNKKDIAIDQVMALPEIKQKNIEVETNSKGKRHLSGYVVTLPTSKNPYYWVDIAEDNDEIEILGFPMSYSIFDLLKTKYRGDVMVKDLLDHHKKQVKMLAYLISRKHVPIMNKYGNRDDMYFGTWIDAKGQYFDTAHFPDSLKKFPFKEGGIYLLLGTVEVDYHFPTVTITRMAKMPLIADPRYSMDEEKSKEMERSLREDVSMTHRKPYPQEHEIGLPRRKMR